MNTVKKHWVEFIISKSQWTTDEYIVLKVMGDKEVVDKIDYARAVCIDDYPEDQDTLYHHFPEEHSAPKKLSIKQRGEFWERLHKLQDGIYLLKLLVWWEKGDYAWNPAANTIKRLYDYRKLGI